MCCEPGDFDPPTRPDGGSLVAAADSGRRPDILALLEPVTDLCRLGSDLVEPSGRQVASPGAQW